MLSSGDPDFESDTVRIIKERSSDALRAAPPGTANTVNQNGGGVAAPARKGKAGSRTASGAKVRSDANHGLLCFQSQVMDMSLLRVDADGTVDWQRAMRDYERTDYVTKGCHLPYDMKPIGDVQHHVEIVNGVINTMVPESDNNYALRHWYAVCCTGEAVRKFLVHTGYGGKNGKSEFADLFMCCLPYISLKLANKAMNENCEDEHKLFRALAHRPVRFMLLEELKGAKVDGTRLCTLVDQKPYDLKQLGCEDTVRLHPQAKMNITGNSDPNLPNDGGVKNRAQQVAYTQRFLNDGEYKAAGGDDDVNVHHADQDLFKPFSVDADHDPKVGFVHVMLPFIAEFYAKGRKLLMAQSYSDAAVAHVEEACWMTAAVAGSLVFSDLANDGKKKSGAPANGPNWRDAANWMAPDALLKAIKRHPAAAGDQRLGWSDFWREAKAKFPKLRDAQDPSKKKDGQPMFFGVQSRAEVEARKCKMLPAPEPEGKM
jgi:hypothetical protein